MATVTIRVIEGMERGRTFSGLATPITIGREEDNDIQLNDDRVSRFHVKLQDDGGRVILTDLDSTNGTRVNGHPVQMKVLQVGDLMMIGRCVLLFGDLPDWSPPAAEVDDERAGHQTAYLGEGSISGDANDVDFLSPPLGDEMASLFPNGAPPPPGDLRPLQRAQVSDILAYLHEQTGFVLANAIERPKGAFGDREMVCSREAWQKLVGLQVALAGYLREIANPG